MAEFLLNDLKLRICECRYAREHACAGGGVQFHHALTNFVLQFLLTEEAMDRNRTSQ